MGKVSKAVKPVNITEKKPKVKKLLNNPGVSKATAKLNLKDARVAPLKKILRNKSDVCAEDAKPSKLKTNLPKPLAATKPVKIQKNVLAKVDQNSVEPKVETKLKPELNVERVSMMKTLKRKSNSENSVKLPIPKKKVNSKASVNKQSTKKEAKESSVEKVEEVVENNKTEVEDKSTKHEPEKTPATTIDISQVVEGVSTVLELAKIQAASKKTLFDGEHEPIFLQVACIKVPKVPKRQLRIVLPNTLVSDTDDIVLFVGDLKKGRAQDFEPTINHYKDLLEENGCTQIKDVIPLTQVKTEYDQYELKRKLLSSYDYFLTEGKIAGHLCHLLGKIFTKKRKQPTSIKMNSKNLKAEIDRALRKTSMLLHSHGDSHIVQVAHTAMGKQEILDNILGVCRTLSHSYPGGWINIRSLSLKTATSLPVPIYITLKSKNKVKVPVVKPTRPKAHVTVSGELSTAPGNTRVFVKPDGTVELEHEKRNKQFDRPVVKKLAGKMAKKNRTTTDAIGVSKKNQVPKKTTTTGIAKESLAPKKTVTTGAVTENMAANKTATTRIAKEDLVPKKTVTTGAVKENLAAKKTGAKGVGKQSLNPKETKNKTKTKPTAKKFEDSEDEIEEAEQAYLNEWQREESSMTERPSTQTNEKPQKKKQNKKKSLTIKKKQKKA